MIFTDRKITIRNGKSTINEPVILYRGDYEVSIKFTIMESKFRFKSGVNLVDSEKASHGQLAILTPYGGNVFSEIVKCEDGTVTFTLTKEMIDQLEEVGLYSFQIRLFDYYRESRVSIPPVEFGIEVREPVASEDHDNEVNNAIVGYSIAKVVDGLNEDVPNTFDDNGQYNKTNWETGDRISEGKLNKIEDAIDKLNQNEKNDVAALDKRVTSNFNVLNNTKADKIALANISNGTPLFAKNTSEMTDTSRNYVNITDGHIYVYNGNNFESTNLLYQATGLNDNSVNCHHINFINGDTVDNVEYVDGVYETINDVTHVRLSISGLHGTVAKVKIKPNTWYSISPINNNRFRVAASVNNVNISSKLTPLDKLLYSDIVTNDSSSTFSFYSNTFNYVYVYLHNAEFESARIDIKERSINGNLLTDKSIEPSKLTMVKPCDVNNIEYFHGIYSTDTNGIRVRTSPYKEARVAKVRIDNNIQYTVRATNNNRFRIGLAYTDIVDVADAYITKIVYSDADNGKVDTTVVFDSEDFNFMYVYLCNGDPGFEPVLSVSAYKIPSHAVDISLKTIGDWKEAYTDIPYDYRNVFINSMVTDGVTKYWLTERANTNSAIIDVIGIDHLKIEIVERNDYDRFRIAKFKESIDELIIGETQHTNNVSRPLEVIKMDDELPEHYIIEDISNDVKSIVIQVTSSSATTPPLMTISKEVDVLDNLYMNRDNIIGGVYGLSMSKGELSLIDRSGVTIGDPVSISEVVRKYPMAGDADIYVTPDLGLSSEQISSATTSTIYAYYEDMLRLYPNYVSREALGVDNYGNVIYGYTFEKRRPPLEKYEDGKSNVSIEYGNIDKIKIILNSGTHGDEKGAAFAQALFLKSLCEKTSDSNLRFIKNNAILKVIPILNPSGFDDNTRNNRAGVNINRDFNTLEQPETRIAAEFISANRDAVAALDNHNSVGKPSFWNKAGDLRMRSVTLATISSVSDIWIDRDNSIAQYEPLGLLIDSESGTMKDYAYNLGMLTTSVECSRNSNAISGTSYFTFNEGGVMYGIDLLSNLIITIMKYHR